MKKALSLLLLFATLLSLSLVGCRTPEPPFDYASRASDYVSFYYDASYNRLYVSVAYLEPRITEEDVYKTIDDALVANGAYVNKISAGEYYVEYGSTVSIRYKGVELSTLRAAGYLGDLSNDQIMSLTDEALTALLIGDRALTKAQVDKACELLDFDALIDRAIANTALIKVRWNG